MLHDLINQGMERVYGNLVNQEKYMIPMRQTIDGSKFNKNFMKNYKMQDYPVTKFNISSFEEIGIVDPFPEDKMLKRDFKVP